MHIPVIDLEGVEADVVGAVGDACRDFGFLQVVNHGIDGGLVADTLAASVEFFAQPMKEKRAISRSKDNTRGYFDRELTKNARDQKEIFDFGHVPKPDLPDDHELNASAVDGINQWPSSLPEFERVMKSYFQACAGLSQRLLEAIALSLGLPADRINEHFGSDHTSFLRLNHYPAKDVLSADEARGAKALGDMALHHHTDAGVLTVLLQDNAGGLQVHYGDEWIDVPPTDGAFVINIGDMMQVWSNGRYHAALHRVRPIGEGSRLSLPFFFNPSNATVVKPLTTELGEAPLYRGVPWGEFRGLRAEGDFDDYGTEVQISDYLLNSDMD